MRWLGSICFPTAQHSLSTGGLATPGGGGGLVPPQTRPVMQGPKCQRKGLRKANGLFCHHLAPIGTRVQMTPRISLRSCALRRLALQSLDHMLLGQWNKLILPRRGRGKRQSLGAPVESWLRGCSRFPKPCWLTAPHSGTALWPCAEPN